MSSGVPVHRTNIYTTGAIVGPSPHYAVRASRVAGEASSVGTARFRWHHVEQRWRRTWSAPQARRPPSAAAAARGEVDGVEDLASALFADGRLHRSFARHHDQRDPPMQCIC